MKSRKLLAAFQLEIINPGALYGTNRIEKLGTATTMEARNTTIVRILEEKGSVIENRHSGIPTMIREMKNYGLPEPEFYEERDSFKVIFRNTNVVHSGQESGQESGQVSGQESQVLKYQKKVLEYCATPKSMVEIKTYLNINSRRYVREKIIKPLIDDGFLSYTNKNNINASNQKYITTNCSQCQ